MKPADPADPALEKLDGWTRAVGGADAFAALSDLIGSAFDDAAVFAVDAERRVVAFNAAAERLLGFDAAAVVGRHCLEAHRCHACLVGCGIAAAGDIRDAPLVLYRADGRPVRVRKTARGFLDAEGGFAGGIEVLRLDTAPAPIATIDDSVVEFHGLVSADPAMHRVFEACRNAAETAATVLVRGESGTGKELLARAVHAESPRAAGPFVAVNCAALAPTLAESELFGHERGAFTGAQRDRVGLFRQAHGGTLFLDEVAELSLELQAKLLRVLEVREVTPVGGTRALPVDVRVVAATHRSLRAQVQLGRFREDLMYRLRVVPLFLPPLRDRRGDIALLVRRMLAARNTEALPGRAGRATRIIETVAPEAMRAMFDHAWPGNVRELRNVMDYAFAVGRGSELRLEELPPELRGEGPGASHPSPSADHSSLPGLASRGEDRAAAPERAPPERAPPVRPPRLGPGRASGAPAGGGLEAEETDARVVTSEEGAPDATRLREALEACAGHVGRAAERLGMSRPTFWRWRKRLGV